MDSLDLDAIRAYCDAATEGPWIMGRHVAQSKAEMIAYVNKCIETSPLLDAFYIVVKEDGSVDIGHTGNGPTSENNSLFVACARTDLPRCLAAIAALVEAGRTVVNRAGDMIEPLDPAMLEYILGLQAALALVR